MDPAAKTGRAGFYIACFITAVSVLLAVWSVRGIRQTNEVRKIRSQIQPLLEKSLELGEQINAEQWMAIEENKAISEELKKPVDQQPADLAQRQALLRQKNEGIEELLKEQQKTHDQIRVLQNGILEKRETESNAVLEKY